LFAKTIIALFFIFMFFQAFFNAYYFGKLDPHAELEIDNEKISFDKVAFEKGHYLIVGKEFTDLHIIGK
jgi:hypothetical protein